MNTGLQGAYIGGVKINSDRVAQAMEGRQPGVQVTTGLHAIPATTVYEQSQALTRAFLDLNPPSRTTAEVVNLLLGSMDPYSRSRTLRSLMEVYDVHQTVPGKEAGIFP